jgi:hypothetical protein
MPVFHPSGELPQANYNRNQLMILNGLIKLTLSNVQNAITIGQWVSVQGVPEYRIFQ